VLSSITLVVNTGDILDSKNNHIVVAFIEDGAKEISFIALLFLLLSVSCTLICSDKVTTSFMK